MTDPSQKPNRTVDLIDVVATLFVIAVLGVLIAGYIAKKYAIPREHYSSANICINNLRDIDLAKNIWSLKFNKATNETPTWDDIKPFLERGKPFYQFDSNSLPVCPAGGKYTIGKIGEPVTCSLGKTDSVHVLP